MKRTVLLILSSVAVIGAAAQELPPFEQPEIESDSAGTRKIMSLQRVKENPNQMSLRVAGYELLLEREQTETWSATETEVKKRRRHRPYGGRIGVLEVGFNGFDSWNRTNYSMYPEEEHGFMDLNMGRSLHIRMNVFTISTSFTRNNVVGLTMGIGFTINDFTFDTPARFTKEGGMIHPVYPDHYLKKAKLHTLALHVPLALEINPSRNFFISAGAYADLVMKSHLKSKFPKEKLHSPYVNFVQAGVTLRLGFRHVYIFGNYALTELFKNGKGPGINPYSFGFGLGF